MDAGLQRRVQRYGWDKAAPYYERSWQAQLEPAQTALLELAALTPARSHSGCGMRHRTCDLQGGSCL